MKSTAFINRQRNAWSQSDAEQAGSRWEQAVWKADIMWWSTWMNKAASLTWSADLSHGEMTLPLDPVTLSTCSSRVIILWWVLIATLAFGILPESLAALPSCYNDALWRKAKRCQLHRCSRSRYFSPSNLTQIQVDAFPFAFLHFATYEALTEAIRVRARVRETRF